MSDIPEYFTLLVEIIYPENKIVSDYGDEEKLVLLAVVDRDQQEELVDYHAYIGLKTGMPSVEFHNHTIDEMIELQKTLPKDKEGFVVRFESGMRVKIKGEEYLRIHKMISHMTPLAFWETMKNGAVNVEYLQELPEEYRLEAKKIRYALETKYAKVFDEISKEYEAAPKDSRKNLGIYIKNNKLKHSGALFSVLDAKIDAVDKYIMRYIRPKGNNI